MLGQIRKLQEHLVKNKDGAPQGTVIEPLYFTLGLKDLVKCLAAYNCADGSQAAISVHTANSPCFSL